MTDVQILKRLYKDYTKKHLKKIILALLLSVAVAGSTSAIAYLLDPAIKEIFIKKDQTMILIIPILIVVAFATKGLSLYVAKTTMIWVSEEVRKDVQVQMLNNLIDADTKLIDNKHTGKFISNITNDVAHLTNLISTAILNLFKDTLTLIGLLGVMFFQNWELSLIAIIMIPLASFAARSLGKRITKVSFEQMEWAGVLSSYLIDMFKNHKLIKIFQKEMYEKNRAEVFLDKVKEKGKKMAIVFVRASPIMEIMTGIIIAILIYYSGRLVMNNEIEISNFFSFLAAMMLAYQPVRSLATLNIVINQGLTSSKRILPIIDEKSKLKSSKDDKELNLKNGNIEFKNIEFSYDNDSEKNETKKMITLRNINLKMMGGKMTSLVGHSGSGKSTILNLIPRIYDADLGEITIDNQSIYKTKLKSLRNNISFVSQDTNLFDDTIKNNIAYADMDATDEEIYNAAKLSYASEFIDKLENKYETKIGENGIRLSGGEKQRLSIARAILKKSKIILLDEATSSLDAETEDKIQKAISFLTKDRTTIVIAHRLSTILNSNKIYVIDSGAVVAEGNHQELMSTSSIYKNFYNKQIKV
ncbi:ABC transporter ATP-binding protein [Candidatus Pelagibacter sp.]|uniref:ABC transporter ATP-binding protein n=1 Tax=Candidatus Pelagibacter sp. TaxID=2024849 RepID=UPI003F86ACE1